MRFMRRSASSLSASPIERVDFTTGFYISDKHTLKPYRVKAELSVGTRS